CNQQGTLIYAGRRDQQVKVRGFRIELGEIEAVLAAHPAVREVAAVVQGAGLSDVHIAAYVATQPDAAIDDRALREHLRQMLPPYMVPNSVIILPSLPRLHNRKIDRARLAAGQVAV